MDNAINNNYTIIELPKTLIHRKDRNIQDKKLKNNKIEEYLHYSLSVQFRKDIRSDNKITYTREQR